MLDAEEFRNEAKTCIKHVLMAKQVQKSIVGKDISHICIDTQQ